MSFEIFFKHCPFLDGLNPIAIKGIAISLQALINISLGFISCSFQVDNVGWLTDLSGEVEPLVSVIFYLILNQLMNISVNDWDKNLFSDKSKSPNGCKKIKVGSPK